MDCRRSVLPFISAARSLLWRSQSGCVYRLENPGVLAQTTNIRTAPVSGFVRRKGRFGPSIVAPIEHCIFIRQHSYSRYVPSTRFGTFQNSSRCRKNARTHSSLDRNWNSCTAMCSSSSSSCPSQTVLDDTIFALSSGSQGAAGVAVIRISGPDAVSVTSSFFAPRTGCPKPRVATLRRLHHPVSRELLDLALVTYFPGPRSFTGEDVIEFHVHGSRAVIAGVVDALNTTSARPAERGEFTRRAFENGRMDLTEVEGLADLIAADTAEQRRQALRQLGGDLKHVFEAWREEVKGCLAHVEAVIDFGDDVDDGAFEAVIPRVRALSQQIKQKLSDNRRGEIVRDGVRLAILGPPNAGKSTLLNLLARRPAAIVSPTAGTTRDVIEVSLDINGIPVLVSDTAGLRAESSDVIEREGMRRALEVASAADIVLFVESVAESSLHAGAYNSMSKRIEISKQAWEQPSFGSGMFSEAFSKQKFFDGGHVTNGSVLQVMNKADLVEEPERIDCAELATNGVYVTSLKTGSGFDRLMQGLECAVQRHVSGAAGSAGKSDKDMSDAPVVTRARHRHHLSETVKALDSFVSGRSGADMKYNLPMDLAAEELRIASKQLGAITGAIHVEEVLDVIFNDFCIGK